MLLLMLILMVLLQLLLLPPPGPQGPPHHYWYLHLDRLLPGKSGPAVAKKILADQLLAAPFFAVTFVVFAALLEGSSLGEAWAEFCSKFPTIYLFDWFIWPPSQALNFLFVPAQFRCVALCLLFTQL